MPQCAALKSIVKGQPPQQEARPLPPGNSREFQGFPAHPRDKISALEWNISESRADQKSGSPQHGGPTALL